MVDNDDGDEDYKWLTMMMNYSVRQWEGELKALSWPSLPFPMESNKDPWELRIHDDHDDNDDDDNDDHDDNDDDDNDDHDDNDDDDWKKRVSWHFTM